MMPGCVLKVRHWRSLLQGLCLALASLAAQVEVAARPAAVAEIRPGFLAGYVVPKALPSSRALLPPPPAPDTAAATRDEEISRSALALRDTPRWTLAAADNDLTFPRAASTFSCAVNATISDEDTPHLYHLLRRSLADAGLSTYAAKDGYRRTRPMVVNGAPACAPSAGVKRLKKDGSYPSGHSAIGWAWALILAELAPGQSDAILSRGLAYGQSRVVCNVHWQSDVDAGRLMGAATVARLHADAGFRADLEAAKNELAAVRAKGLRPQADCQAEAAALANQAR